MYQCTGTDRVARAPRPRKTDRQNYVLIMDQKELRMPHFWPSLPEVGISVGGNRAAEGEGRTLSTLLGRARPLWLR
jgi:hypothetical protein